MAEKSLHIALVVPAFVPSYGGPYYVAKALATELLHAGNRVTLLTSDLADATGNRVDAKWHDEQCAQMPVGLVLQRFRHHLRYNWASLRLGLRRQMRALFQRQQIDVVHCCGYRDGYTASASMAAQDLGVSVVWEPMGMAAAAGRSVVKKRLSDAIIGRKTLHVADAVIATADQERQEQIQAGVHPARIHLRANGIDTLPEWLKQGEPGSWRSYARAQLGLPDNDGPIMLFLGRLSQRKGLSLLRELGAALALSHWKQFWVGPVEPEAQSVVEAARSDGHIQIIGAVNSNDKWLWLAAADVFVLPSHYGENFAIAALEAHCAGTAVLLSPAVGYGSWLHDSDFAQGAGAIVEGDAHKWVAALRALEPCMPDGAPGLDWVQNQRQKYSWKHLAAQQLRLYEAVCNGGVDEA